MTIMDKIRIAFMFACFGVALILFVQILYNKAYVKGYKDGCDFCINEYKKPISNLTKQD